MWVVDKVIGRLIDKASVKMSAKMVWFTIAVLAALIAILSKDDEEEPEVLDDEAELRKLEKENGVTN
jgi:hypothetical protein